MVTLLSGIDRQCYLFCMVLSVSCVSDETLRTVWSTFASQSEGTGTLSLYCSLHKSLSLYLLRGDMYEKRAFAGSGAESVVVVKLVPSSLSRGLHKKRIGTTPVPSAASRSSTSYLVNATCSEVPLGR